MRNEVIRAAMKKVPFMLHHATMDSLLEMANSETPRSEAQIKVANNSVAYSTVGKIAIIAVDGAMHKKDIGGMCSSVVAYPSILQNINKAEADENIDTIIFRVDTPGGSVFGADEVEERIYKSKKKTITFFENIGASGGIYIFMASDEVYASEGTQLGSIGVVVSYMEEDPETKKRRVEIVSKNAENKRCSLKDDCKSEIKTMIDTYESIFYDRVMKNTGFTAEKIKSTFNSGGMIFATEAQKSGFIKEVTTFSELLKSINSNHGSTFVPSASIAENTKNTNQGADMELEFNQDNFNALVANRKTLESRLETQKVNLQTAHTALEAKTEEMVALVATHTTQLSEAEGKVVSAKKDLDDFKAETTARLQEAVVLDVPVSVALAMVQADTKEEASALTIDANASGGATQQDEIDAKSKELAFQQRCAKLGITVMKR